MNLFGGFTVLNSRFKRFGGPDSPYQAPMVYPSFAPIATTCEPASLGLRDPGILGSDTRIGGWTSCLGNVSGNRTALAPKFAASLGASYVVELPDERELRFTGMYNYNSGYYFEPDNVVRQDSYSLFNASAEYRFMPNIGVEVWGKNLGNKVYAGQKLTSVTGTTTIIAPPRTYGVTMRFDY